MLHQEHGGPVPEDQLLQLHPGKQVDVVQGLVPHVQVGPPAQAGRQQDLFLLAGAVLGHIPFKELPAEVQLAQDGEQLGPVHPLPLRPVWQRAGQVVRLLGYVGDEEARGSAQGPGVGELLPQGQAQQAGLARPVAPLQAQPLSRLQGKGDRPATGSAAIGRGQLPPLQQAAPGVGQGEQLQLVGPLHVPEQGGLLPDGLLLPALQPLGPLHQLGGPVAHKAPVHLEAGVLAAVFAALHLVRPGGGAPGGLLQPADLPLQLLVPGQLPPVPGLLLPPPHGEAPPDELRAGAVQSQGMVGAAVQKGPVVGDQEKAPVQPPEVVGHQGPALGVQVVGGLVNHGVGVLPEKEGGQQGPGLLPAAEGGEGPVQDLPLQPHLGQLPVQPPRLLRRRLLQQQRPDRPHGVGHRPGPAQAGDRAGDGPPALRLPRQQLQQGGLAPAVPAHQAQLPAGIQPQVQVLEHGGIVPVIGKREMRNGDL